MKNAYLPWMLLAACLFAGCGDTDNPVVDEDTSVADTSTPSDVVEDTTIWEDTVDAANPDILADTSEEVTDTVPEDLPISEGQEGGYISGGVLGSYYGVPADDSDEEMAFLFRRLDKTLDFPNADPAFAEIHEGNRFEAHWKGGIHATSDGVYTFRVTVADGAKLTVGDVPLIDAWETGTYTTETASIELTVGWHPLELTYGKYGFDALLVLAMQGPADETLKSIDASRLGYSSAPPADEPSLSFQDLSIPDVWSFGASVMASTSAPAMVTASWDGTTHDDTVSTAPDELNVDHHLMLTLAPETDYQVTVSAQDLWGRSVTSDVFPITTPVNPAFVSGGMLGTYYNGTEFGGTPVAQRFDPEINLPANQDNNLQGSFATPMGNNNFTVRWEGALWAPETDTYILYLGADDGARLTLDEELIIDAWDSNAFSYDELAITLTKGWHPMTIEYLETGGTSRISLEWATATMERMVVPSENLGTNLPDDDLLNPEVTFVDAYSSLPETFTLQWKTSELCTAQVFYTTYNQFDKVVGEEVVYDFNTSATGMKWTFENLMPGYGQAQIVVWDRFGHVSAVVESEKILVLEDEED